MNSPANKQLVFLLSSGGSLLTHFETDRETFPEVATWERDRVFHLHYQGGLFFNGDHYEPSPSSDVRGAVYQQVECWKIGTKTLNEPKSKPESLGGAVVLPFAKTGSPSCSGSDDPFGAFPSGAA